MEHFEKLGAFYLGKPYDLINSRQQEGYLLYDSRDLLTHGVCVGMTGSGKTGLCVALLEEAAIDKVPAIVIDPKGDLTNLLLSFPDLLPEDFLPWINEDDARKKSLSPEDYARDQAETWRKGLADWGQDGERIRLMRQSSDFCVYTPGSSAGIPVSILKSFAAPPKALLDDAELFLDHVAGTAASLLGLVGIGGDSALSRESILLSTILTKIWTSGQDLDLASLISLIQDPPLEKIGIMDLESFYPAKDRFNLALQFNNLLASPNFAAWLSGEPLDIGQILYAPTGKPRIAIFSIAHLDETWRQFFVSLILNQILSWIRTQSGTTSLRALLYMDEIYGYFPPVENPPTKKPLLTLLKQARAYGLGILLTTQNPVDLDYKGLSNAGTWFIGRLQTERDKLRVLDGLEAASTAQGSGFDRASIDKILSGLGNRIFLMHNVHDDQPTLFETRWCMSYLRGPLTRNQIQMLKPKSQPPPMVSSGPLNGATTAFTSQVQPMPFTLAKQAAGAEPGTMPPVLPQGIRQLYLPFCGQLNDLAAYLYKPAILGFAQLGFRDSKTSLQANQDKLFFTDITNDVFPVDWSKGQEADWTMADLADQGIDGIQMADLPEPAALPKNYATWDRDFAAWLYQTQQLELLHCPALKMYSAAEESERDFRIRLAQKTKEIRDEAVENLRTKYAVKLNGLSEKIRRSEQAVEREAEQAKQQNAQTAISLGATILSSFLGKKRISASSLGRATTTIRGASRSFKEKSDVERAKETVEAYKAQLQEMEDAFKIESDTLAAQFDPDAIEVNPYPVRLLKTNIQVRAVALLWLPCRKKPDGTLEPAWR